MLYLPCFLLGALTVISTSHSRVFAQYRSPPGQPFATYSVPTTSGGTTTYTLPSPGGGTTTYTYSTPTFGQTSGYRAPGGTTTYRVPVASGGTTTYTYTVPKQGGTGTIQTTKNPSGSSVLVQQTFTGNPNRPTFVSAQQQTFTGNPNQPTFVSAQQQTYTTGNSNQTTFVSSFSGNNPNAFNQFFGPNSGGFNLFGGSIPGVNQFPTFGTTTKAPLVTKPFVTTSTTTATPPPRQQSQKPGPFKPGTFVPSVPIVQVPIGDTKPNQPVATPIKGPYKPNTFVPSVPVVNVNFEKPPITQSLGPEGSATQTVFPVKSPLVANIPQQQVFGSASQTSSSTRIPPSSPQLSPPGLSLSISGLLGVGSLANKPSSAKPNPANQPFLSFLAELSSSSSKPKQPTRGPTGGYKPPPSDLNIVPFEPSGPFFNFQRTFQRPTPAAVYGLPGSV